MPVLVWRYWNGTRPVWANGIRYVRYKSGRCQYRNDTCMFTGSAPILTGIIFDAVRKDITVPFCLKMHISENYLHEWSSKPITMSWYIIYWIWWSLALRIGDWNCLKNTVTSTCQALYLFCLQSSEKNGEVKGKTFSFIFLDLILVHVSAGYWYCVYYFMVSTSWTWTCVYSAGSICMWITVLPLWYGLWRKVAVTSLQKATTCISNLHLQISESDEYWNLIILWLFPVPLPPALPNRSPTEDSIHQE